MAGSVPSHEHLLDFCLRGGGASPNAMLSGSDTYYVRACPRSVQPFYFVFESIVCVVVRVYFVSLLYVCLFFS